MLWWKVLFSDTIICPVTHLRNISFCKKYILQFYIFMRSVLFMSCIYSSEYSPKKMSYLIHVKLDFSIINNTMQTIFIIRHWKSMFVTYVKRLINLNNKLRIKFTFFLLKECNFRVKWCTNLWWYFNSFP